MFASVIESCTQAQLEHSGVEVCTGRPKSTYIAALDSLVIGLAPEVDAVG
jgi:hypothetical protein